MSSEFASLNHSISLPKDPLALCRTLTRHAVREDSRLRQRRMMWLLAWYYLNGHRRFEIVDQNSGTIRALFVDEQGNLEFQSHELLYIINRTAARLASMDFRPRVQDSGGSLTGVRSRSVGQIIMDSVVRDDHLFNVKRDFAYLYTCLGSAGLCGHITDHPTIGLTSTLEVVHPRELFPFPSLGQDHTKTRGLMRYRAVPLETLEERFGKISAKKRDQLDYFEILTGDDFSEDPNAFVSTGLPLPAVSTGDKESLRVARVKELWIDGVGDTCSRYVCTSGDVLLSDESYDGREVYCPIGFRRFYENGTFHGAGLFDTLFPIARQFELNIKQLFKNVREIDQYGVLVIPSGQFNERSVLKNIGSGLRALPWEPDPLTESFKPFPIAPFNAGETPGKVAQFARSLLGALDPSPDISDQKGRVDSAQGLAFLDEQATKALTFPAQGIERVFSAAYRGIAAQAVAHLTKSPRALPVQKLTLDLAGAVIDPENLTVSFQTNPIPDLSRLSFSIRDMNPKSEAARKMEALELTKLQLQDRDSLLLYTMESGLELAMWTTDDKNAYDVVVRNILLLYGNGMEPAGDIVVTPETVKPGIQLRVLNAFMSSLRMAQASPEVVDHFQQYREFLLTQMAGVLPNAAPNPDDVAMMAAGPQQSPQRSRP
jgi:hypothetical protein